MDQEIASSVVHNQQMILIEVKLMTFIRAAQQEGCSTLLLSLCGNVMFFSENTKIITVTLAHGFSNGLYEKRLNS